MTTKKELLKMVFDNRQDAKDMLASIESDGIEPNENMRFMVRPTYHIIEEEKPELAPREFSLELVARFPQDAGTTLEEAKLTAKTMRENDKDHFYYVQQPNKDEIANGVEYTIKQYKQIKTVDKASKIVEREQEKIRKANERIAKMQAIAQVADENESDG